MRIFIIILTVLILSACKGQIPQQGSVNSNTSISTEAGFSRFCAGNPHKGTCP